MPDRRRTRPPRHERRTVPRRAFPREVRISRGAKSSGLTATDLSPAGMRVAATDLLELGDEVTLSLGDANGNSVRVKAVVARDDGDQGWMLRFCDVGADTAARLDALVRSLPDPDESGGAGVVLSEILRVEEPV